MTAQSRANGHPIYYDEKEKVWKLESTGKLVPNEIACHKCGKRPQVIDIHGGYIASVDDCIADIVASLNKNKVKTEMACCGHGRMPGVIVLSDDRHLGVFENREHYDKYVSEKITHTIYGEEIKNEVDK